MNLRCIYKMFVLEKNHLFILGLVCYAIIHLDAANFEFFGRKNVYFNSAPFKVGILSGIGCCTSCGVEESCVAANYNKETSVCELLAQKPQVREDFVKRQNRTLFIKSESDISDDSWVQFNQNVYHLVETKMNWRQADGYCMTLNAELVDIHSIEEQAFVFNFISSKGSASAWIGLNDIAIENVYEWSSGRSLTYTGWAPGQPSNDGSGEDCVNIGLFGTNKWNDSPCSYMTATVCEKILH